MMIDVRELGPLQLDGLREVANIGAGHAATAMSQLTGKQIWIDVPQIRIFGIEDVGRVTGADTEVVRERAHALARVSSVGFTSTRSSARSRPSRMTSARWSSRR